MKKRNKQMLKNVGKDYSIFEIEEKLSKKNHLEKKLRKKVQKTKQQYFESGQSKHNDALLSLMDAPELIGINDKFYHSRIEEDFFKYGRKMGGIDVYIETNKENFAIEYKCNDSKSNRDTAIKQLNRARKYMKINQGIEIDRLLYVHNDFQVKELTVNGWKEFNYTPSK